MHLISPCMQIFGFLVTGVYGLNTFLAVRRWRRGSGCQGVAQTSEYMRARTASRGEVEARPELAWGQQTIRQTEGKTHQHQLTGEGPCSAFQTASNFTLEWVSHLKLTRPFDFFHPSPQPSTVQPLNKSFLHSSQRALWLVTRHSGYDGTHTHSNVRSLTWVEMSWSWKHSLKTLWFSRTLIKPVWRMTSTGSQR